MSLRRTCLFAVEAREFLSFTLSLSHTLTLVHLFTHLLTDTYTYFLSHALDRFLSFFFSSPFALVISLRSFHSMQQTYYIFIFLGAQGVRQAGHNIFSRVCFFHEIRFNGFEVSLRLRVFNTVCRGVRVNRWRVFRPLFLFSFLSLYSI